MSKNYIDGINFHELPCQKYWAPPNSWTKEKRRETTKSRIFSDEWYGARKIDGAFYKFIKDEDGNIELLGRSKGVGGDYLNKVEWVPQLHKFFNDLPNGTCFLGELYIPNNEGSNKVTTIMGCLKDKAIFRQENYETRLHYYIFDVLAFNGQSFINEPFERRIRELKKISVSQYDCVHYAIYKKGQELWELLEKIFAIGGEGIVMTHKDATYKPGKRPSKECMKVKKEITNNIDCFFTGKVIPPTRLYTGKELETWQYWQNTTNNTLIQGDYYNDYFNGEPIEPVTKPYFNGWAGSLYIGVLKDGKVYTIGSLSGLTDEIKSDAEAYKGKVIEVSCMEIMDTENKGLRHAKLERFRPDLTIEDCTWEKIYG